jgi:hypothetical protein
MTISANLSTFSFISLNETTILNVLELLSLKTTWDSLLMSEEPIENANPLTPLTGSNLAKLFWSSLTSSKVFPMGRTLVSKTVLGASKSDMIFSIVLLNRSPSGTKAVENIKKVGRSEITRKNMSNA